LSTIKRGFTKPIDTNWMESPGASFPKYREFDNELPPGYVANKGRNVSTVDSYYQQGNTGIMSIASHEVAEVLGLSPEEVERCGLHAFIEKELRAARTEIRAICQKYDVTSWEQMDALIVEGGVEEGSILDDFQRVDHLTSKAKRLQALLEKL
jgi:hypothetical protein